MATQLENRPFTQTLEREAELHNAQIKRRYEQLRSTEESQLQESIQRAERDSFAARNFGGTATIERPIIETPQAPTYSHSRVESSLFTTETRERTIAREKAESTVQTAPQAVAAMPVTVVSPVQKAETFSMSNFAKAVAAAFVVLVILMLSVIAVNSRSIQRKNVKIRQLEEQRQELIEESGEIQARIQEVTCEDYVARWAEANGFTKN